MTTTPEKVKPDTGPARLSGPDRSLIGLLVFSAFVVIFNETVMSLALPRLMADLSISAATAQWLTTGFLLVMAVVIPATGFIMERFTLRQIFIAAMGLFSAGTAIAAVAPGFELLLLGRIVQAGGTGVMMPLVMTTAMTLVPANSRGRIMGVISIVISVAPAIGPTVSGLVLSRLSWRWLFLVVLPIALATLALGAWKVRNITTPKKAHLDVLSLLLSAIGFGGLIYGLSSLGEAAGHTPVAPWIPVTAGVVALVLFVWRQRALQSGRGPLMDLRVFAHRSFTVSLLVLVTGFVGLFGALILLPIYLQNVHGVGTLQAGLLVLPGGVAMGVLSPIVGRLFDRYGPRPLVTPGTLAVSAGLWLLSTVGPGTALPLVVVYHMLLTSGLATLITPLMTSALSTLPMNLYGHGSAIIGTLQQLAGAAGTALFITVLSQTITARSAEGATLLVATTEGIQAAFVWGGVISLVAVALSLLVRRSEPLPEGHLPVH
ncbi:MDR family MFS transporter [Actinoplanes derwentensis]|uniref:MFS transporter, DHA2 family, lincomycin resistance protein n=1 Tax=Actinoplanes derwentensis TaxID=113562 RepID=A0A1H1VJ44_9ACTN|nr:MDR family MFS transporter [Actinoplanes derwentensis]GID83686.1 MFS transporter [Actinoplanes derwentensis]SDS84550.1 MFS transporter, DHA2 family, lincomycin resistance protein [Actinoplanes derwentensis]